MARVLIANQPWGLLYDGEFTTPEYASSTPVLTTPAGAAAKVYTTETGTTLQPSLATDQYGRIPGWVEEGTYLLGTDKVEAVAGRPGGTITLTASGDTSGVVDSANLAAAVTALGLNGGKIRLGGGSAFYWNSTVDVSSTRSVTIEGAGGLSAGLGTGTTVYYLPSTGPVVNAATSYGFRLRGVYIQYQHASFASKVIDLSGTVGTNTAFAALEDVQITGISTAIGATSCVSLDYAHSVAIRSCKFGYAVCAVKGRDSSGHQSNRVLIEDCDFGSGAALTQAPIQNAGQGWTVDSCTFEPLASGNAGAYSTSVTGANGMAFTGCWFGDANTSGTWIAYAGSGLVVQGNYITGGSKGIALAASTLGATITGNHFEGFGSSALTTGVDVAASCQGIVVTGNYFVPSGATIVTNPITLADDPQGSIFQRVSNDNTTPLTFFPGKVVTHDWLQMQEITAPAAPAADNCRMFLKDNGSGKTQLCALFSSGAVQVIATQP